MVGKGSGPLYQHSYPVTTNKAHDKYELKDMMQKAHQKAGGEDLLHSIIFV